jgi:predicted regulator of Ras-like GTPase activity (Roadblock/LC7/MglB family)
MGTNEDVEQELENLLRMDDIKSCMVASRGLDGITPPISEIEDIDFWHLIKEATDEIFPMISEFYENDLDKIYLKIQEYEVSLSTLTEDSALLVIYPQTANRGLIEVEIENTRREIEDIFYS